MQPLTPNMLAALDLLAATGERALVRLWSEWWVREADQESARRLGPAHTDLQGRLQSSPAFWAAMEEPHTVVGTATVKALRRRGLLKLTGPKRLVAAGGGKRKDHHRAELTPAGLELIATRVETARAAYADVLSRMQG